MPHFPSRSTNERPNKRQCRLPDAARDTFLKICQPSQTFLDDCDSYTAPMPRPRKTQFDNKGLRGCVDYVNNWKRKRVIYPRLLALLNRNKDKCEAATTTSNKRAKANLIDEITIDHDMLSSKWDSIHGPEGLCNALTNQIQALDETRLMTAYGDYFTLACAKIKSARFDNEKDWQPFKFDGGQLDWQGINAKLEEEERAMRKVRKASPSMELALQLEQPYTDEVAKAVDALQTDFDQIRWEIEMYAKRNNICHSSVARLMKESQWFKLGEQILYDKKTLSRAYQNQGINVAKLKIIIQTIEDDWYECLKEDMIMPNQKATDRSQWMVRKQSLTPLE